MMASPHQGVGKTNPLMFTQHLETQYTKYVLGYNKSQTDRHLQKGT